MLWDVDHTLVDTGGVGREAFAESFERATGLTLRNMIDPSGLTEGDIFRQTARAHGIVDPEPFFARFVSSMISGYASRFEQLQSQGRALPGARAALAALAARPEVLQAVLTGNLREVARLKLAAFGLDQFIAWEFSASAEDGSDRLELLDAARERALTNAELFFGSERTMIIGDTANDVRTALRGDVSVIAVASGRFTVSELRDAGAHVVLTSLDGAPFDAALSSFLAEPK